MHMTPNKLVRKKEGECVLLVDCASELRYSTTVNLVAQCHVPDMNPRCVHPDVYTSEDPIGVRTYGDLRSVS